MAVLISVHAFSSASDQIHSAFLLTKWIGYVRETGKNLAQYWTVSLKPSKLFTSLGVEFQVQLAPGQDAQNVGFIN